MKRLIGNSINGNGWEFSTKKLLYVLTSIGALVGPWVLYFLGDATGAQMFDFWKYFSLGALGLYGGGKWIDSKCANNGQ